VKEKLRIEAETREKLVDSWLKAENWNVDLHGRDMTLEQEKDITGYKACIVRDEIDCESYINYVYVELLIPANAKRIKTVGDLIRFKCRAEYAIVKRIFDKDNNDYNEAYSFLYKTSKQFKKQFKYVVGEKVIPDGFDENVNQSCGKGINFHKYIDHCDQWFRQ